MLAFDWSIYQVTGFFFIINIIITIYSLAFSCTVDKLFHLFHIKQIKY